MKVHYHQPGRQPLELVVIADNNGDLDLAYEEGQPAVIEGIRLSARCTLIRGSEAKAEATKASQSGPHGVILPERTEALRLAALAIDARKLADDAKGQQGVGALREAAEAAEKAAKEADTAADAAETAAAASA